MNIVTRTFAVNKAQSIVWVCIVVVALSAGLKPIPASAQVLLPPSQLDQLVSRIALYPDPLLSQVLAASTYSDQIPEAAQWADQHSYLTGGNLAAAISEDNLAWDPSVLALLPFPSVLDLMATDLFWTRQLGDAVLSEQPEVMNAVQRMREKARGFGYLQDCPEYRVVVSDPGIIEIVPVDPAFCFVPTYDPMIVFGRPRVGLAVGITFGPRVSIGAAFAPWGWSRPGFGWASHTIILDGHPWVRTRENRATYVHPYTAPRRATGPRVEHHELRPTHPEQRQGRKERERER
jgi:Protein of unknown function (DUF3300)